VPIAYLGRGYAHIHSIPRNSLGALAARAGAGGQT
jgi:hypothetical protein